MALDQLLKRNFWLVVLPMIAIAALLNATAVTQLVGMKLAPDDAQLAIAPASAKLAPLAALTKKSTSAEAILSRNPFDSATGPLKPPPGSSDVASTGPVDTSDPWNAPACDGVKVLVITASGDPDWSFAAFGEGGKSILRRRGGEVSGKTVHFVGWDRVWMQSSGSLCQAFLFAKQPQASSTPAPATSSTPEPAGSSRPGAKAVDPSIAKGIQKVSATEFNVDRGVVDKILENQSELMRQARIVPEQENGRTVGIRMFGIRSDTLLGTLGMENGDRLQTINGFDMSSPEKALEAYARLRTADKLTVQVNRRGQNMNLDYNIK